MKRPLAGRSLSTSRSKATLAKEAAVQNRALAYRAAERQPEVPRIGRGACAQDQRAYWSPAAQIRRDAVKVPVRYRVQAIIDTRALEAQAATASQRKVRINER